MLDSLLDGYIVAGLLTGHFLIPAYSMHALKLVQHPHDWHVCCLRGPLGSAGTSRRFYCYKGHDKKMLLEHWSSWRHLAACSCHALRDEQEE